MQLVPSPVRASKARQPVQILPVQPPHPGLVLRQVLDFLKLVLLFGLQLTDKPGLLRI